MAEHAGFRGPRYFQRFLLQAQRCRIDKVTSSAGSARNQMKRVWLFARYGIIGLALDDVPGVRA
jgi:hypothetical protein